MIIALLMVFAPVVIAVLFVLDFVKATKPTLSVIPVIDHETIDADRNLRFQQEIYSLVLQRNKS